ncbi:(2Fe-2S)-binding protein [Bradyrhizobium diazoefficiens]|nr:(2Fe-2S)-binding protein [Bradyrhizobium diazoefficiens]MBR0976634.1 (2Fe-2S)-binding protein [Bradyrhizobium diazoefficiens]MBR1005279.1 (2Fe-2S)-binding protein [Bradyrhizobium diazoefficiens]MBR1011752.1 (2Fe-2S)-binding protein [Bradyrhizobium diazoefficiens]MBR1049093.1 (2Fe-2S)-binding protein [Bradyrhizobium diazoefficiens]
MQATSNPNCNPDGGIPVEINVNGKPVTQNVQPRLLLSDFIRENCALVATHVGCGEGACGACTVLMNGRPVRSCTLLAVQADGMSITTVEGLNAPAGLNRVQAAFQHFHALQCGYCTPGLLATVTWMVEQGLPSDDATIMDHLAGHLCRCTGYQNILLAVCSLLDGGFEGSPPSEYPKLIRTSHEN